MNEQAEPVTSGEGLAGLLAVLRGTLAVPSGSEDDPWQRVLLPLRPEWKPSTQGAALPPLEIPLPLEGTASAATRESIRATLAAYIAANDARPSHLAIAGQPLRAISVDDGGLPLSGKTAIVTGAAGAIGAGICRGLLNVGCRVAATDVDDMRLEQLLEDLHASDPEQALAVHMDVTSPDSVASAFASVIEAWGGVDLVVVNAGVAMVARLTEMDFAAFQRVERINVDGTLLTLAEAGRHFELQGTGGDIVLISTKNVFSPGAQFGAYSATKAASHQLARIASLELAPLGVRVNMVAPDAVFSDGGRRSGLWAEVGPSRMKARGLDEAGLEDYYRDRNLLKTRVTANHVANAVLFFATRQTPTTGATLPVDGGLPDSTPR